MDDSGERHATRSRRGEVEPSNERSLGLSRRSLLATLGAGVSVGMAGCGDGGGSGGSTGDDSADDGSGGDGGAGGTGDGGDSGGGTGIQDPTEVDIQGIEVTKTRGRFTVGLPSDSNVNNIRLFGPDGEQLLNDTRIYTERTLFPRGANLGSLPEGTYRLEAVQKQVDSETVVDSASLNLQRSFEIAEARFEAGNMPSEKYVAFDVRNTGQLPVNFEYVRVLTASEVEGYEQIPEQESMPESEPDDLVLSTRATMGPSHSGQTTTYHGEYEFLFRNVTQHENFEEYETPPEPPCADWTIDRRYELVGTGDYSRRVDVTISITGGAGNPRKADYGCGEGEVVEFSPVSG